MISMTIGSANDKQHEPHLNSYNSYSKPGRNMILKGGRESLPLGVRMNSKLSN